MWKNKPNSSGYGIFWVSEGNCVTAHRFSYELAFGPTGLQVLHHCDMRLCVRPTHLFTGTQADNIRDMMEKGRHAKSYSMGEDNANAKMDWSKVNLIRASNLPTKQLAKMFGVTDKQIRNILNHHSWRVSPLT